MLVFLWGDIKENSFFMTLPNITLKKLFRTKFVVAEILRLVGGDEVQIVVRIM